MDEDMDSWDRARYGDARKWSQEITYSAPDVEAMKKFIDLMIGKENMSGPELLRDPTLMPGEGSTVWTEMGTDG